MESENSPVMGSKKVNGKAPSSTDQRGEPSGAVVAATPEQSLEPYPTTGGFEKSNLSL